MHFFALINILAVLALAVCRGETVPGMASFNCVVQPTLQLEAGVSNMTSLVNLPMGRQCEATMYFSDPSFLPMTFSFNATSCERAQINTFQVPNFSPNGEVHVVWQCSNMATGCSRAEVFGGTFDSSEPRHVNGDVGCLQELIETRTALMTHTRTSGTVVETVSTVLTLPTTMYSRSATSSLSPPTINTKTPTTRPTQELETIRPTADSTSRCSGQLPCNPVPTPGDVDPASGGPVTPLVTDPNFAAASSPGKAADDTIFVSSNSRAMIPAVTVTLFTTITATVTQGL